MMKNITAILQMKAQPVNKRFEVYEKVKTIRKGAYKYIRGCSRDNGEN